MDRICIFCNSRTYDNSTCCPECEEVKVVVNVAVRTDDIELCFEEQNRGISRYSHP